MITLLLAVPLIVVLESSTSDPLTWLINLGVAGIVIVLLVTGKLRTESEVKRLEKELDEAKEVINAIQSQLLSSTLPALARSTQVIEAVPATEQALVIELQATQAKAVDMIERMERLAGGSG